MLDQLNFPTTHPNFLAVDGPVGAEGTVLDEAELIHHLRASPTRVHHLRQYTLGDQVSNWGVSHYCRCLVQCMKQ